MGLRAAIAWLFLVCVAGILVSGCATGVTAAPSGEPASAMSSPSPGDGAAVSAGSYTYDPSPASTTYSANVSVRPTTRVSSSSASAVAAGWRLRAAEDVPTVVFSRSRAPGLADNFDNAVADGAPTRLDRVGAAARDANRRAALRGQPPAPAGQSLDEYPFACSAQGGCGSFVGPVPASEQNYQGGVLSSFFQREGVNPGDPFNVKFGP
jgi:hypothetical protein